MAQSPVQPRAAGDSERGGPEKLLRDVRARLKDVLPNRLAKRRQGVA